MHTKNDSKRKQSVSLYNMTKYIFYFIIIYIAIAYR